MPKRDIHDPFDPDAFAPIDLGRFNCAGRYVYPLGTPKEQERRNALQRIGLDGRKEGA